MAMAQRGKMAQQDKFLKIVKIAYNEYVYTIPYRTFALYKHHDLDISNWKYTSIDDRAITFNINKLEEEEKLDPSNDSDKPYIAKISSELEYINIMEQIFYTVRLDRKFKSSPGGRKKIDNSLRSAISLAPKEREAFALTSDEVYKKCFPIIYALNLRCMYETQIINSDKHIAGNMVIDVFDNLYDEYVRMFKNIGRQNYIATSNYGQNAIFIINAVSSAVNVKIPQTISSIDVYKRNKDGKHIRFIFPSKQVSVNYYILSAEQVDDVRAALCDIYGDCNFVDRVFSILH